MAKDKPVGYGNPPKHTRFKKGQSGNPKGRPKRRNDVRSTGFAALIAANLAQTVKVRQGGVIVEMTQADVLAQRLMKSALDGDPKAIDKVLKLIEFIEDRATQQAIADVHLRYQKEAFSDKIFNLDL